MEKNILTKTKYLHLKFLLSSHINIAIDLDETLIGSNKNKFLIRKYIVDFPDKNYILITFRDVFHKRFIKADMEKENCDYLLKYFDEIVYCPYTYNEQRMKENEMKLKIWKGYECYKRNYTALIDDNIEKTINGALKYKIHLVDSKKIKRVV